MQGSLKWLLFLSMLAISFVSYANDKSRFCPENSAISSSQGLKEVVIAGYNFQNKYFYTRIRVNHPANDAPSIRYTDFNFRKSEYDPSSKTLSCTYFATRRESGEPDIKTFVSINNVGHY